jgi:hypothetical protein
MCYVCVCVCVCVCVYLGAPAGALAVYNAANAAQQGGLGLKRGAGPEVSILYCTARTVLYCAVMYFTVLY